MSAKTVQARPGLANREVRPVRLLGRTWRRVIWVTVAAAGFAALLALGFFSGSTVGCERAGTEAAPELRCAFEVAAPRQEVWTAFVETEVPRSYYFDTVLQAELEAGGRWRFVTEDRGRLLAAGEIVELQPPARLEMTFAAADLEDAPSRLAVGLEAVDGGTRVEVTHGAFAGETATFRRFRRAHPLALSAMKSVLETGRLPLRARIYTAIFKPGMKWTTVRAAPWEARRPAPPG
jgi:uncharacterized protein YndB with AHSA1/START domain